MSRLTSLTFKVGAAESQIQKLVVLTPITVFVGPNNSGKSLALREVAKYCRNGAEGCSDNLLVASATSTRLNLDEVDEAIARFEQPRQEGMAPENLLYGNPQTYQIQRSRLRDALPSVTSDDEFCRYYLQNVTLVLDGHSRISLADQHPMGDLRLARSQNSFQTIARD